MFLAHIHIQIALPYYASVWEDVSGRMKFCVWFTMTTTAIATAKMKKTREEKKEEKKNYELLDEESFHE